LLALYDRERDADAFALLVRRHGPMVLGVCRRTLGNSADADDAFQATFLALARNAGRVNDSIPGWLFRVAVRTSRRALRRHRRPAIAAAPADAGDPFASVEWRDLRRLLDEELDRLPANLRTPLVLCYLDGRTRDEAAQQLGWSLRTLHRRLDEGRKRLRERLGRRGIAPALLAAAVSSADELRAQVPPALARDAAGLATRAASVPSKIQSLVPKLSSWGGLAMKTTVSALIVGGIVLLFGGRQPAGADPVRKDKGADEPLILALAPLKKEKPPDPLAEKVKEAQEKAVSYLKSKQMEKKKDVANWENDTLTLLQPGGTSALALLALLESGLKPDDPAVATGLNYLRELKPQHTYVVSLTTQVFCKANQKKDTDQIKTNVKWLEDAAIWTRDGQLVGWSYTANPGNRADNSNTRYAVSGLYAAHKVGFKVKKEKFWEAVRDYYVRTQTEGGGWTYQYDSPVKDRGTHTMTLSGVLGLLQAKEILGKDDKDAEKARQAGFDWVAKEFRIKNPPHTFYNIDLIAAVGRASERKDLGTKEKKREWYREGAEWLIENQKPGGEWRIDRSAIDEFPIISTSFALRFLASRPED
jgi:RNA polymerase sigma factor (sigma-70 family)